MYLLERSTQYPRDDWHKECSDVFADPASVDANTLYLFQSDAGSSKICSVLSYVKDVTRSGPQIAKLSGSSAHTQLCLVHESSSYTPYIDIGNLSVEEVRDCIGYNFPPSASYDYLFEGTPTNKIYFRSLFGGLNIVVNEGCSWTYELDPSEASTTSIIAHIEDPSNLDSAWFNPGYIELDPGTSSGSRTFTLIFNHDIGNPTKSQVTLNIAECTCASMIDLNTLSIVAPAMEDIDLPTIVHFDPFNSVRQRLCQASCGSFSVSVDPVVDADPLVNPDQTYTMSVTAPTDASCTQDCYTLELRANGYSQTLLPTFDMLYKFALKVTQDSDSANSQQVVLEVEPISACPIYMKQAVAFYFYEEISWDVHLPMDFLYKDFEAYSFDNSCHPYSLSYDPAQTSYLIESIDQPAYSADFGDLVFMSHAQGEYHHMYFDVTVSSDADQGASPISIAVELHVGPKPATQMLPFTQSARSFDFYEVGAYDGSWQPTQSWTTYPNTYNLQSEQDDPLLMTRSLTSESSSQSTYSLQILFESVQDSLGETYVYNSIDHLNPSQAILKRNYDGPLLKIEADQSLSLYMDEDSDFFCAPRSMTLTWKYFKVQGYLEEGALQHSGDIVDLIQTQIIYDEGSTSQSILSKEDFDQDYSVQIESMAFFKAQREQEQEQEGRSLQQNAVIETIKLPSLLAPLQDNCRVLTHIKELTFSEGVADLLGYEWLRLDEESNELFIYKTALSLLELEADLIVPITLEHRYENTRTGQVTASEQVEFTIQFKVPPCVQAKVQFLQAGTDLYTVQLGAASGSDPETATNLISVLLPEAFTDTDNECETTLVPSLIFSQSETLGTDWYVLKAASNELVVLAGAASLASLETSLRVKVEYHVDLLSADYGVVLDSDELNFTLALLKPEQEETLDNQFKKEVDQPKSPELQIDEKPIQSRAPSKKKRESAVQTKVSVNSAGGSIKLEFQRPINLQLGQQSSQLRMLKSDFAEVDRETILGAIRVDLVINSDIEQEPSVKKVDLITASTSTLEIQIHYENLLAISYNPVEPDQLFVALDESVFQDPESDSKINDGKPIVITLPRQTDAETLASVETAMSAVQSSGGALATSNSIVNVMLGFSLKALWGMINTLQFVVFFSEWKVQIPANASVAIATFRSIALAEFIPSEWFSSPINGFMSDDVSDGEQGSNQNVLANMGNMLLIILVIVLLILLVSVCIKQCKPGGKLRNFAIRIKNKLIWNSILRFTMQSYLKNSIACLIAIAAIQFNSFWTSINALLALLVLIVLSALPFCYAFVLKRMEKRLADDQTKQRVGSLYLGVKTNSILHYSYSSVFLARRWVYALITVIYLQQPNICIHTFLVCNVANTIYLVLLKPAESKHAHQVEVLNDYGLQLISYHLALFPLMRSSEDEESLGFSMIASVCLLFAFNIMAMIWGTIRAQKYKLRVKKIKAKMVVEQQKRVEQRLKNDEENKQHFRSRRSRGVRQ